MPKIWKRVTQKMSKKCQKYARAMPKIWPIRHSKCLNFTPTWFQVKKNLHQKVLTFHQNLYCDKLPQFLKYTLKYTILLKYPKIPCKYTNKSIKLLLPFISGKFYRKKNAKMWQKNPLKTKHSMFRATNLHQSRKLYMNAVPDIHDIYKVCAQWTGYSQYMPKICPKYVQDMPNICQRYAQDMSKICSRYVQICPGNVTDMPRYSQYMPKICPIYAQDMTNICPIYVIICQWYAQDMPKICLRYAQDMPTVCQIYAQDMPKICSRYAQDLPKICLRYAKYSPKRCQIYVHLRPKICPRYVPDMSKKCLR